MVISDGEVWRPDAVWSDPTGTALVRPDGTPATLGGGSSVYANVKDFGAKGDGVTDDSAAFIAAIASVANPTTNAGGKVIIPKSLNAYYLAQDIKITRLTILEGEGGPNNSGSALLFADGKGLKIYHANDSPDGYDGSWSIIQNLKISCAGSTVNNPGIAISGHGVVVRDSSIDGFGGQGIYIGNSANGGNGNANDWQLINLRVIQNVGDGVLIDGADSNAGCAYSVNAASNGGWGIYDSSFLGNTFVACSGADNTLGQYKTDNWNARSVFIGCYSESGQPASDIIFPSLILGGLHGAGLTAASLGYLSAESAEGLEANSIKGTSINGKLTRFLLAGNSTSAIDTIIVNDTNTVFRLNWKWPGSIYWNWNNLDASDFLEFLDVAAVTYANGYNRDLTNTSEFRATCVNFPAGYFENYLFARVSRSSLPTTDTWKVGDIIYNTAPTAGGYMGWTCTASGTMGTLAGITGTVNNGSKSMTVNSATGVYTGQYITIAGVTAGPSGVNFIDAVSGTTVTLHYAADASVVNAAVAYASATFKTFGAISA
jgi:hypothetical protein